MPANSGPAPSVTVVHFSTTSATVVVHDPTGPFWMVLGESTNAGWHAISRRGRTSGTPQLIDGYANGWLVTPTQPGHDMVITLHVDARSDWCDVALVASAATLVLCAAWRAGRRAGAGAAAPCRPVPCRSARPDGAGAWGPTVAAGRHASSATAASGAESLFVPTLAESTSRRAAASPRHANAPRAW